MKGDWETYKIKKITDNLCGDFNEASFAFVASTSTTSESPVVAGLVLNDKNGTALILKVKDGNELAISSIEVSN